MSIYIPSVVRLYPTVVRGFSTRTMDLEGKSALRRKKLRVYDTYFAVKSDDDAAEFFENTPLLGLKAVGYVQDKTILQDIEHERCYLVDTSRLQSWVLGLGKIPEKIPFIFVWELFQGKKSLSLVPENLARQHDKDPLDVSKMVSANSKLQPGVQYNSPHRAKESLILMDDKELTPNGWRLMLLNINGKLALHYNPVSNFAANPMVGDSLLIENGEVISEVYRNYFVESLCKLQDVIDIANAKEVKYVPDNWRENQLLTGFYSLLLEGSSESLELAAIFMLVYNSNAPEAGLPGKRKKYTNTCTLDLSPHDGDLLNLYPRKMLRFLGGYYDALNMSFRPPASLPFHTKLVNGRFVLYANGERAPVQVANMTSYVPQSFLETLNRPETTQNA